MQYDKPYGKSFPNPLEITYDLVDWDIEIELTDADLEYLNPFFKWPTSTMTVSC